MSLFFTSKVLPRINLRFAFIQSFWFMSVVHLMLSSNSEIQKYTINFRRIRFHLLADLRIAISHVTVHKGSRVHFYPLEFTISNHTVNNQVSKLAAVSTYNINPLDIIHQQLQRNLIQHIRIVRKNYSSQDVAKIF